MTTRLYFDDAYLTRWTTRVKDRLEREDGVYVVLEESAFYPHGGGQPNDTGRIGDIPVLDVISEGDEVLHKVERIPEELEVGCEIDWDRRFDHMQQHSGQHLLSAVCREHGAMTLSFHLGSDSCTIDVDRTDLPAELLAAIEREANRHIYLNHRITGYFVTEEEASRLPLVKPPKVVDRVRIVEMEGVEYNGCGGTHVSGTGAIGMIKLLKTEKQKGHVRIFFKCGYRALSEFQEQQQVLGAVTARLKTGRDGIMERLDKWEDEQKGLQSELDARKEAMDEVTVGQLLAKQEGGRIAHIFADKPLKELQNLAQKLIAQCDAGVLLATEAEHKVVLAHSGRLPLSCSAFFKEHLASYGGKGGGSDKLAQAGFSSWPEALAFYEFAEQALL
ncbi:DHHA1 domain-containing protein [Paenibacillus timonensis]|uniref:DHHA1 domain-containing protein n=1 Tax=Paenibacillus timonensis TaxID=225915 RepID=A0ABW3SCX8_9BACL|nr:DHHA1 domain-containing protein [Paenibacillus timonensis]MCH1640934.1 DHHA1 domain-containing protein [Paenibacillus timonensis]